jgi:outer membrane protein assembly factor BamB
LEAADPYSVSIHIITVGGTALALLGDAPGRHGIFAFDMASGIPLWHDSIAYWNAAAVDSDRVGMITVGEISVRDARTGREQRTLKGAGFIDWVSDGLVLYASSRTDVANGRTDVRAFGLDSGARLWTVNLDDFQCGMCDAGNLRLRLQEGFIYVEGPGSYVYSIDATRKRVEWKMRPAESLGDTYDAPIGYRDLVLVRDLGLHAYRLKR